MNKYDNNKKRKRSQLKQHQIIPKSQMKMPEKNIAVQIRKGLVVFTDHIDKVEQVKIKYADK